MDDVVLMAFSLVGTALAISSTIENFALEDTVWGLVRDLCINKVSIYANRRNRTKFTNSRDGSGLYFAYDSHSGIFTSQMVANSLRRMTKGITFLQKRDRPTLSGQVSSPPYLILHNTNYDHYEDERIKLIGIFLVPHAVRRTVPYTFWELKRIQICPGEMYTIQFYSLGLGGPDAVIAVATYQLPNAVRNFLI